MANILRFFSRRKTARPSNLQQAKLQEIPKNSILCKIILLDGTDATFIISVSCG